MKKYIIPIIAGLLVATSIYTVSVFAPYQLGTGTATQDSILTSNGPSSFASWKMPSWLPSIATGDFTATSPLSLSNLRYLLGGSAIVSMTQSNATTNGWLASADWTTFNSKQSALNGAYVSSITGTANQITASKATGDITLSIPNQFTVPGALSVVSTADFSGKVGIGTSPSYRLHAIDTVSGSYTDPNFLFKGGGNSALSLDAGTGDGFAYFYLRDSDASAKWSYGKNADDSFGIYNFGTSSTPFSILTSSAVYINNNSTVGLVAEQDGVKDNVLVIDTTNGGVGIMSTKGANQVLTVGSGAMGYVNYNSYFTSGSFNVYQGYGSWNTLAQYATDSNQLVYGGMSASQWQTLSFYTNASERMRITASGDFSIGNTTTRSMMTITDSPIATLSGGQANDSTLLLRQNTSATGGVGLEFGFGATTNSYLGARIVANIVSGGGADLHFQTGNSSTGTYDTRMYLSRGGNLGIGTIAPDSILDLNGAITLREVSIPATPDANSAVIWLDSASNNLRIRWDSGATADIAVHP